jgi:hypothetical protein
LTRIANKEIKPNGSDCSDSNVIDDIQDIMTADGGNNYKKEKKPDPHPKPTKICPKDGQLFVITFVELSAWM